MITDRIQQALKKAQEYPTTYGPDEDNYTERTVPSLEHVAALAVIEAARFVYDLRDDRHYDANEGAYLVGERSLAKLQHAVNAWADAVLGSKQP